jgi:hypothetical protein
VVKPCLTVRLTHTTHGERICSNALPSHCCHALALLTLRGSSTTASIESCQEVATLDRWLERVLGATRIEDVLDNLTSPGISSMGVAVVCSSCQSCSWLRSKLPCSPTPRRQDSDNRRSPGRRHVAA